jgi:hypothetical protein
LAVVELEVLFSAERFTAGDGQSVVRRGRGPQPHEGAYILTKNVGTYAPPALMGSQPRRGGLAKPRPTAWERQWFSELSPEGATYGMRAYHAPSGLEVGNELSSYPYHPGRWPGFARPPLRGCGLQVEISFELETPGQHTFRILHNTGDSAPPAVESAFSPLQRLHRKEAPRETEPGQARTGEIAWGLAVVKLAVLLLEWRVRAPHGSTGLSGQHRPVPSEHRRLQKAGV